MRKLILGSALGLCFSLTTLANSFSVTVLPGTMTNLLSFSANLGSVLAKQFIATATTGTNFTAAVVDTPTNLLQYTQSAYTNTTRYATNGVLVWTNFYGVLQSNNMVGGTLLTNWWLVDVTNNLVSATTNSYPVRLYVGAPANGSSTYGPVSGQVNGYYFDQGIWVTNTGSGVGTLTVVY